MLTTIIVFIIAISILVFVHEMGHFLAARAVGVEVPDFSIGFPPTVVKKTWGKTTYKIGIIPLGGYVRIKGQDPDDEDANDPTNYASKNAWQKFFILVAGPLMNLFFALLIMPMVYVIGLNEVAYLSEPLIVHQVEQDSAAMKAGLKPGDRILAVNDQDAPTYRLVIGKIDQAKSDISLEVDRAGSSLKLTLDHDLLRKKKQIGIEPRIFPRVGLVNSLSPADKAGLKANDVILQVGEDPVLNWGEITPLLQKTEGRPTKLLIERNGEPLPLEITPQKHEESQLYLIGIAPAMIQKTLPWSEAWGKGAEHVLFVTGRILAFLGQLFTGGVGTDSLGGPVMIAKVMGDAAKHSLSQLLQLTVYISIQLFLLNLLPIPALDGGHILFLVIEAILRRPIDADTKIKIQNFGFSFLLLFILLITIQDSFKLINW